MVSARTLPAEAERDRVPYFRRYRDLTEVSTPALIRTAERLREAIEKLRPAKITNIRPLEDGLADVEHELRRRSDSAPAVEVERVSHVLRPGSGARLIVAP